MDRQPPNRRAVLRGGVLLAASALVGNSRLLNAGKSRDHIGTDDDTDTY
jgi:hypothetical protein